jgi:hypothetical protein
MVGVGVTEGVKVGVIVTVGVTDGVCVDDGTIVGTGVLVHAEATDVKAIAVLPNISACEGEQAATKNIMARNINIVRTGFITMLL